MENSPCSEIIRLSRKPSLKRSSSFNSISEHHHTPVYKKEELKMLLYLCLIEKFREGQKKIIEKDEQESEDKRKQTISEFKRSWATLRIDPIKKEIIMLSRTAKVIDKLHKKISAYFSFSVHHKIIPIRRSLNSSMIFHFEVLEEPRIPTSRLSHQTDDRVYEIIPKSKPKYDDADKENKLSIASPLMNMLKHKRYASNLTFLSSKNSLVKQVSSQERREKIFLSKKKHELNEIKKMNIEFSSQSAEVKALLETMEIFQKNLNRSNHFLKMIDESIEKGPKITIYLQELIKLFELVLTKMEYLSKLHPALILHEPENEGFKVQIAYFAPFVKDYYRMGNEIISYIRHFTLSLVFKNVVATRRPDCLKLTSLLVESRYVLRYLEKEIDNLGLVKKKDIKIPKWQKAYRLKFLPKNTLF